MTKLTDFGFHKYAGVPFTFLGLAGGLLYGAAKNQKHMNNLMLEFEKDDYIIPKHMQEKLDASPIPIISTMEQLKKTVMYKKEFTPMDRIIVKNTFKAGDNAFFVLPEKYGEPMLIVPKRIKNKKVLLHEFGHYLDAKERDLLNRSSFRDDSAKSRSMLQAIVSDPKKTPWYKSEHRAWEHSSIPVGDPAREAALGTYETAILTPRYMLGGGAVGGVIDFLRATRK